MKSARIRLGRGPSGQNIFFDPFIPQHLAVTGRSRFGKSVMVYGMLAQMKGLPARVTGIDPTGILFNSLNEGLGGSALRVSTLQDPEHAGEVITELVAIMDERIRQLMTAKVDKFEEFTEDFPLLIVLLEEYAGLMAALQALDVARGVKAADRIETRIRAAIQRLALEGAKVGVRVWAVSQRGDASILSGVLRSQLSQRISFAQDAEGLRMLHESITSEQIEQASQFLPGQAFAELPGQYPGLVAFRADLMTYSQLVDHFKN